MLARRCISLALFAVALISRARIHGVQVLERYEDLLEPTRAGLAPLLGADFAGIRAHRLDQRVGDEVGEGDLGLPAGALEALIEAPPPLLERPDGEHPEGGGRRDDRARPDPDAAGRLRQ